MKEFIEIPLGAKDSELCRWEYTIPEGFVASIENGKIIVKKEESEDEKIRKGIIKYLSWIKDRDGSYMPNNIPFDDMIIWLEKQGEQKYTDKVEPNPTWSEADERNLKSIMKIIKEKAFADYDVDEDNNMLGIYGILESWLKSLKPQPQWKPSEEQIQALEYQVNSTYKGSWQYKASKELLEQLKKL